MSTTDREGPLARALVLEEDLSFSLVALCHASGASPEQIHALVAEGLLLPQGQRPQDWQFGGEALPRTRIALRLARDLEMDWGAVVLVLDLLAEIGRLRDRLLHP